MDIEKINKEYTKILDEYRPQLEDIQHMIFIDAVIKEIINKVFSKEYNYE